MERSDLKKRKHEVEKKIVMFMNSWWGMKCAKIFEFHIKLTNTNNIQSVCYNNGEVLKPINSFYDQRESMDGYPNQLILSVGACAVGSKLYMFPDDGGEKSSYPMSVGATDSKYVNKEHTLIPLVYDISTRNYLFKSIPVTSHARKMGPIVALVGMEIFVLSAFYDPLIMAPEPSFEAFGLDTRTWRDLAASPINSTRSVDHAYSVTGYAVINEDFLLVSLSWGADRLIYYTYSFRSNLWKDTNAPVFMDNAKVECRHAPCLNKQALVVGHDIYNFYPLSLELIVFSYTECGVSSVVDYDITLGPATLVQGFVFNRASVFIDHSDFIRTTVITKVEDDIYCLFHTIPPDTVDKEKLHVLFIQLLGRELCKKIHSFTCDLYSEGDFLGLSLESCHVMDAVKSDQQRGKRAFNEAAERDCGFTIEEEGSIS